MTRYFIEVYYKGTHYAGFQIQQNARSIQQEVTKALGIFFRTEIELVCSSRTDAGVHALQNFFHFDTSALPGEEALQKAVYNLNAILPRDIVVKRIYQVNGRAHCRFDARSRVYRYFIYQQKDPFQEDRAFYFPYKLDIEKLNAAASIIMQHQDFTAFSKRNTQVKTFNCTIYKSQWLWEEQMLIYQVEGNRFLRGMVRGLVGTMLKVGTGKLSVKTFIEIIESKDLLRVDFSVPPQALFLCAVNY